MRSEQPEPSSRLARRARRLEQIQEEQAVSDVGVAPQPVAEKLPSRAARLERKREQEQLKRSSVQAPQTPQTRPAAEQAPIVSSPVAPPAPPVSPAQADGTPWPMVTPPPAAKGVRRLDETGEVTGIQPVLSSEPLPSASKPARLNTYPSRGVQKGEADGAPPLRRSAREMLQSPTPGFDPAQDTSGVPMSAESDQIQQGGFGQARRASSLGSDDRTELVGPLDFTDEEELHQEPESGNANDDTDDGRLRPDFPRVNPLFPVMSEVPAVSDVPDTSSETPPDFAVQVPERGSTEADAPGRPGLGSAANVEAAPSPGTQDGIGVNYFGALMGDGPALQAPQGPVPHQAVEHAGVPGEELTQDPSQEPDESAFRVMFPVVPVGQKPTAPPPGLRDAMASTSWGPAPLEPGERFQEGATPQAQPAAESKPQTKNLKRSLEFWGMILLIAILVGLAMLLIVNVVFEVPMGMTHGMSAVIDSEGLLL